MPFKDADGLPSLPKASEAPITLYVLADHDSLRRSLVALLEAWGAKPPAFKKPNDLVRHWRDSEHRPRGTIIDTHGLERSQAMFLHEISTLNNASPLLFMHSSNRHLQRDLEEIDGDSIVSLIKPYRIEDLFRAVERLIAKAETSEIYVRICSQFFL